LSVCDVVVGLFVISINIYIVFFNHFFYAFFSNKLIKKRLKNTYVCNNHNFNHLTHIQGQLKDSENMRVRDDLNNYNNELFIAKNQS
jgi:hypothetical protein